MKETFVKSLELGERFVSYFALRKKEFRTGKEKSYLLMELGDKTGRIRATYWEDDSSSVFKQLEKDQIVKVEGVTSSYKNAKEVKVSRIRMADEDEFCLDDYLPISSPPPEELFESYRAYVEKIENPHLKRLFEILLEDEDFTQKLMKAPGGKLWHHAYLGGMLKHTLAVTNLCEYACKNYDLVDKDLLIAAALLHDIGKVEEFSWDTYIDYSEEGRLSGHSVLGQNKINKVIDEIDDFPQLLKRKLLHLILSHHGEEEYGAPVEPKMIEGVILFYSDMMDSQADAFSRIINNEKKLGDEDKKWSDWVNLIDRYIYLE